MNWKSPFRPLVALDNTLERGVKAMLGRSMVFRPYAYRVFGLPRSDTDYLGDVGDGTGSSTVTAPLFWVARTFPEAPPMLWRELDNGQEEKVSSHPMLRLLQRPNQHHTGRILWMATVIDYMVDGNAYWMKLRNKTGMVTELWWTPSWLLKPMGSDKNFITHYEYTPGIDPITVKPEDIVHFRFGLDNDDMRLGKSPLKSVLREVYTDDEAAGFTASLLRNMGVPGLIVSPKQGITIEEAQAETTKATLMAKFTGDRRGEPIVMTGATDVEQFGFSPEQLLLRELRRIPEERVTAVMGVPAVVARLGAGLDRSTFTNYAEAREAAYEQGIIPMQGTLSEEVRFQLLSDFEDPFGLRFGFDLSKVRVLQDDLTRTMSRMNAAVAAGVAMRSEARRAAGLQVDEARDNVFLIPLNTGTVPASDAGALSNGKNGSRDAAVQALAALAT